MRRAYIGLGANLGQAAASLQAAAAQLAALPGWLDARGSALYRSAPIDSSGPDYWNAVLALETERPPEHLLASLLAIEQQHGRERPYRNAPRTLDLDLLAVGELRLSSPRLSLPHPRLQQRAFVLLPLLELAPELTLPGLGPLAYWLPGVRDQRIERSAIQLLNSK